MTWAEYEQMFYELQDWDACEDYLEKHGLEKMWLVDDDDDEEPWEQYEEEYVC